MEGNLERKPWDRRRVRFHLLALAVLLMAGRIAVRPREAFLPAVLPAPSLEAGCLLDATLTPARRLAVLPPGTKGGCALAGLGLTPWPGGTGETLLRAGVAVAVLPGSSWRVRPMTQKERWIWGIPMELAKVEAGDVARIPGVGPALSERIVSFLRERGGRARVADLTRVPGVGAGRSKVLSRHLCDQ